MNTPSLTELKDIVILSDGHQGLRTTITAEVREPISSPGGEDAGEGEPTHSKSNLQIENTLDFISSDQTLDRYDEIITASGWKLENYQRNPVFQNSHQYEDVIHTLGRALVTEVRGGKLYQRIQFATAVNPLAKLAFGLYKGKFLNAVSVGFVPIHWENGTEQTNYRRKYLEQELLEVSAVSIPANPNALALAYKSGAIEKSDIRELSQLLRSLNKGKEVLPQVPDNSHALRLAQTLNDLLRRI
jgi:HK97 family phage prohead protease